MAFGQTGFKSRAVGVEFNRIVNEAVTTKFLVGYDRLRVDGGMGEDFDGVVFDAAGSFRLTQLTQLNVAATRRPYQSFTINNDYYISLETRAALTQQIGSRTYWEVSLSYRENDYPEPVDAAGLKRHDRLVRTRIGVGYHLSNAWRTYLGYNFDERRSNVESVSYHSNQIVFRLEAGWL